LDQIWKILSLVWNNIGWIGINIFVPVTLPPAGLLLARLMPLQDAEKKRTRVITTIQDGQLGWLALAWSAASIYEAWEYMDVQNHVYHWVGILLAFDAVIMITAMFIAAGGAVTADNSTNRPQRLSGSIIVAIASGAVFIGVHLKTLS